MGQSTFGEVKVETRRGATRIRGSGLSHGLDPKAVRVELYADGVNGREPVRQEMKRVQPTGGRERLHL